MSVEAMKQALDALEAAARTRRPELIKQAITALRTAIAEVEKQEPVAVLPPKEGDRVICIEDDSVGTVWWTAAGGGPYIKFDDGSYGQWSLQEFGELFRYTAPAAQRQWVGLTDEEIEVLSIKHTPPIHPDFTEDDDFIDFARAIEAKLKEKNNG